MNIEPKFCFLGDMLCADEDCELAVITRFSVVWVEFKKLFHKKVCGVSAKHT